MVDYNKSEIERNKEWLEKDESTLVDALLILNEKKSNESERLPSVVLLNLLVIKEIPSGTKLTFPYQSTFLLKIKEIISLILSGKIKVLQKPESFVRFDQKYYFNETFQNRFLEDSKILLGTKVRPIDFVTQLLEYKNILPETLLLLIKPDKKEPADIQASKLTTPEPNKPIRAAKAIDPREEKTLYKIIYSLVKKHYKYDPNASKNADTSKIVRLLQSHGFDVSPATIKRILDKAFRLAEEELDQK
jgi:hypothetical protein